MSVFLSCAVRILKWTKQHGQSQFGTDGHITYGNQIDFESDAQTRDTNCNSLRNRGSDLLIPNQRSPGRGSSPSKRANA